MLPVYFFTFFYPAPDAVTVVLRKEGRASPVYTATRTTRERALLAALNGADIAWVPGTCAATRKTRVGKVQRIRLEFRAGAPSSWEAAKVSA